MEPKAMKWVTRARPKNDRIAYPWRIARFIDKDPEFLYVPAHDVLTIAEETGATPNDIPDVELPCKGELYSIDPFLKRYNLADPALHQVAAIVRSADISHLDLTQRSGRPFANSLGLFALLVDDRKMLRRRMVLYDALYAWCRQCQGETHSWPPGRPV